MARFSTGGDDTADRRDPTWPLAFRRLMEELRALILPVLALGLVCAVLGGVARSLMPQTYTATAEVMIDPRGFQVFKNDLTSGASDANAAVNYVESQIHIMLSERVLARAMLYASGEEAGSSAALTRFPEQLRKSITVSRAERSYILGVSVRDNDPQAAARMANAIIRAYLDEDADSRSGAAERLTGDLSSRLELLRSRLAQSEAKVEDYRRQNNLVSADDRLIVDQQLASAVTALGAAEERLSAIRARAAQLQGRDDDTTAAMASPSDQALFNTLVSRQLAIREEVARLSIRLGNQHPSLRAARSQQAEVEALLKAELARMRQSGQGALRQAQEERDALATTVARLTAQTDTARQSSIELRALEQQVLADREVLASFETRTREADEFGKVDSANVRVLSTAHAPDRRTGIGGIVLWSVAGGMIGLLAGLSLAALRALSSFADPARQDDEEETETFHDNDDFHDDDRPERAIAPPPPPPPPLRRVAGERRHRAARPGSFQF